MRNKIFALLLALVMMLSFTGVAYADEIEVDAGDVLANVELDDIQDMDDIPDMDSMLESSIFEHYMVDNADLLTDSQRIDLEAKLTQKSEELDFDIVIVTEESIGDKTPEEYADDYYDYNDYGRTESKDGCLLLISMEERDWHISTTGYGIIALTDAGLDYIADQFLSDLSDGAYYDAFETYADCVADFVTSARDGKVYDVNNLPKPKKSFDPAFILYGVVTGLIVAGVVISIMKGKLKSVRSKAEASDYLIEDSFVLTNKYDLFKRRHISKTARQSSSSGGGSSTHTGSSGTSHGGSGGKF